MGDSSHMSGSSKNLEAPHILTKKHISKRCLVAAPPMNLLQKTYEHMISLKHAKLPGRSTSQIVSFLLKLAALELVRRLSKAKCPFVWRGVQAFHALCCLPFKWIQRWAPLNNLVKGMQDLHTGKVIGSGKDKDGLCHLDVFDMEHMPYPTIVACQLSADVWQRRLGHLAMERFKGLIASKLITCKNGSLPIYYRSGLLAKQARQPFPSSYDQPDNHDETSDSVDDSQPYSLSPAGQSTPSVRIGNEIPENFESENWLQQLHKELENQGIALPERIDEDELHRFYTAAGGDFPCFLSSIKRTIRWRETYCILSAEELEMWSHLVFWHGCDVKLRPCLIIRLGLACSCLESKDRPRFAQAVVSQMEHGVLHLVNVEDPRITVLMDCEGISAYRFPMQMMRSFSTLVQDHYPNRLACLFVVRLPPVVRVIAQTFIQILKPVTREKLHIEGEMCHKILSEHLHTVPAFLGGHCTCDKCGVLCVGNTGYRAERNKSQLPVTFEDDDLAGDPDLNGDLPLVGNCEQVLRTAIVGILMLWILIAFIAGMYDPESPSLFAS